MLDLAGAETQELGGCQTRKGAGDQAGAGTWKVLAWVDPGNSMGAGSVRWAHHGPSTLTSTLPTSCAVAGPVSSHKPQDSQGWRELGCLSNLCSLRVKCSQFLTFHGVLGSDRPRET